MPRQNKWKRRDCLVTECEPSFELGTKLISENNPNGYSIPVKMTIRTNTPVSHWQGNLVHELSGMTHKGKVHLDWVHDSRESIGFLNKFDVTNQRIKATGQLISVEPGDTADIRIKQLQAGIPMEASIFFAGQGLKAEEFGEGTAFKANGKSMVGPAIVFRKWPLRGVALVPFGADNNTSASLALSEEEVSISFTEKGNNMDNDKKKAEELEALEKKNAELTAKLAEIEKNKPKVPTGKDFMDAFGEKGAVYFAQGKSFEEGQILYNADLKKENEVIKARLAAVHKGGEDDDAPGSQDGDDGDKDNKKLKSRGELKMQLEKSALILSPRLTFFATGIQLPGDQPKEANLNEMLTGLYKEMVIDVGERYKERHQFASMTLLDIAIQNAADGAAGLIDETIQAHPELDVMPARTIMGINYKTLVLTTLPTVAFRNAAEGTASTRGVYVNRLVETFIISPSWAVDKAIADRHEDGAATLIAREARTMMEAVMQHLSSQFYYGTINTDIHATKGDAKGFNGLHSQLGFLLDENILVDGEGSTADTGSSVWMVRGGEQNVQWVWGNNGSLAVSPVREERIVDSGGTNKYTAYFQEMLAYPGLQIGSTKSIGRIGELTEDTNDGLTDAKLAKLWSLFPVASKPDHIFMSRRSQRQLRDSRFYASGGTVVGPTGQPVPFVFAWEGVPIHVTDAIIDTEKVGEIADT